MNLVKNEIKMFTYHNIELFLIIMSKYKNNIEIYLHLLHKSILFFYNIIPNSIFNYHNNIIIKQ